MKALVCRPGVSFPETPRATGRSHETERVHSRSDGVSMKTLSTNNMFMLPGDGTAASVDGSPFCAVARPLQRLIQEYAWAEAPSNPSASEDDDDRDSVRLPPQPPLPPQADVGAAD